MLHPKLRCILPAGNHNVNMQRFLKLLLYMYGVI
jgi:hypothetical protein